MLFWIRRRGTAASSEPDQEETLLLNQGQRSVSTSPRHVIAGLRIATTCLFALALIYTVYRFYHARDNPRPPLPLDGDLVIRSRIPGEAGRFGLTDGDRLVMVNGTPVRSEAAYRAAVRRASDDALVLEFENAAPAPEHPTVRVLWQEADSAAAVQIGDALRVTSGPEGLQKLAPSAKSLRITHVNGIKVSTPQEMDEALNTKWAPNPVFRFESAPDAPKKVLSLTLVDWDSRVAVLVAGIATGVIAVGVIWLKGFALSSWGFHILCLNIALFSLARAIPFPYRTDIGYVSYFLAQTLFPATCIFFLITFCPPKNLVVRPPSRLGALSVLIVGLLAALASASPILSRPEHYTISSVALTGIFVAGVPLALFLFTLTPQRRAFTGTFAYAGFGVAIAASLACASAVLFPGETSVGLLGGPIFSAWQIWIQALFVFTLISDYVLRLLKIPLSPLDQKRAGTVRIAALFAFLPILVYVPLRGELFAALTQPRIFAEAALTLFPLVLAHGILRQNVLKVGKLMLESATYVVLLMAGFVVYPVAAGLLTLLVSGNVSGGAPAITALAVAITVFLCGAWVSFLRTRFAKTEEIGEGVEARFLDNLHGRTTHAESVNEVYSFLETELDEILGLDRFDVVLVADALPLGDVHISQAPRSDAWEVQGIDSLCAMAAASRGPLFLRDLEEGLGMPEDEVGAREALQALGASLAIPLTSERGALGVMALGRARVGDGFSRRELAFLGRVATRAGTSLSGVAKRQRALAPARAIDIFPRFPEHFGEYALVGVIGQGGMSYVYEARRAGLEVALKIANHRVHASPLLRSRFDREAEILGGLRHNHIVSLIDSGTVGEEPFIALEYLPLGSLSQRLRQQGPLAESVVRRYLRQLVGALAHAQSLNVIHRDIKPHNIYLATNDTIRLGDFGAARFEDDGLFTLTGEIVGTVAYMSPERLDGKLADWRSDQYALGVTAYELLTGRRPFKGRTLEAQIVSKIAWTSLDKQELFERSSDSLARTISRMLMPDPDDRYPSYNAILADIRLGEPMEQPDRSTVP